jgi:hypothetical protein
MDLTRYGIDPENLKETMTALIEERRANAETSHFDETGVM